MIDMWFYYAGNELHFHVSSLSLSIPQELFRFFFLETESIVGEKKRLFLDCLNGKTSQKKRIQVSFYIV